MSDASNSEPPRRPSEVPRGGRCPDTRWTYVLNAADPETSAAALEVLCRDYWYPIYAYIRRSGRTHQDAEDLTQDFMARLLDRPWITGADPQRGRFRTYLLNGLRFFLQNEWQKSQAQKRGGGRRPLSIDSELAEARYGREPANELSPDLLFGRRWALATLEQAMRKLRKRKEAEGKAEDFQQLRPYLTGEGEAPLAELAAQSGESPSTVRARLRRLRLEFREQLREQVAHTLDDPALVDREMECLFEALKH